MTNFKKTPFYPLLLLIALGFTWGTSFSIARFAMESGITPLGYLFWQTAGPACLLYILIFFIQKKSFVIKKNQIIFYILTGILGILLPNYVMFLSATHVPSGIMGLIVNTSPILTYILSLAFFIEKFQLKRSFGVLLGVIGLFLLILPNQITPTHLNLYWVVFAFLAPVLLASSTIFIVKFKDSKINSLEMACGMLIAAAVLIMPITFLNHAFHPITTLDLPNLIILLEIVLSTIGFVLFFELLKISGPVYYSLVSCLVAISGFGWGYLVFNETLKGTQFISIILTVFAVYFVGAQNKE